MTVFYAASAAASPRLPIPATAYDGGIISAESWGRGATIASNRGTPASGSENPAALVTKFQSSLYTTYNLGSTSDLSRQERREHDPLSEKVFHYGAIGAEKGVFYFEPIARVDGSTIEFTADAIGFAGADNIKDGSIGISLAYLRASATPHTGTGTPQDDHMDTADGVRLNLGARYPTGPTMWGIAVQNAPGFLWWKNHKRDQLPLKVRVGNTWRVKSGALLSLEWEQRYYKEGSNKEDYLHFGGEVKVSDMIFLRSGVFANDIGKPEDRHWTGGLTIKTGGGAEISYAIENFELNQEKVNRSFLSVTFPFDTTEETSNARSSY